MSGRIVEAFEKSNAPSAPTILPQTKSVLIPPFLSLLLQGVSGGIGNILGGDSMDYLE
jgi:hypothetical protein